MQHRYTALQDRLFLIDTQFVTSERVAAYLLHEPGAGAALVDCGGSKSVSHMLAALAEHGVEPEQVLYLLPTHVHIDHAGGVGDLLQFLPNARVFAHPKAVKHLVEPERLMASSIEVYGQQAIDKYIGPMRAVDPERIAAVQDYQSVQLGARELQFIDTPGHAYHHYVVWDKGTGCVVAGDSYGNSYSSCAAPGGYVFSTPAVPTQFDPPAWRRSLVKLARLQADYAAVAHFGIYSDTVRIAEQLTEQLHHIENFATNLDVDDPALAQRVEQELYAHYEQLWRRHNCYREVREVLSDGRDLRMVVSGIVYWLRKTRAASSS